MEAVGVEDTETTPIPEADGEEEALPTAVLVPPIMDGEEREEDSKQVPLLPTHSVVIPVRTPPVVVTIPPPIALPMVPTTQHPPITPPPMLDQVSLKSTLHKPISYHSKKTFTLNTLM